MKTSEGTTEATSDNRRKMSDARGTATCKFTTTRGVPNEAVQLTASYELDANSLDAVRWLADKPLGRS